MNVRSVLLSVGFALLAWFAGSAVAADPPRISESPLRGLEKRWLGLMKAARIPGCAVVVVRGDDIIALDAFGVRSVESNEPVTPSTMFYIASCTKPFNAMAAMALAEDGKLKLDDPVRKHLPRFSLSDADLTARITLRDLMCHRFGVGGDDIVFHDAYTGLITDDLYFKLLPEAPLAHAVSYSNVHYTLLGRVLQSASGKKDWRELLEERILRPAGMTRTTGYASRMYGDTDAAVPHVFDAGRWLVSPARKTDRTMHAAGGLGTTAADLGRWIQLHLNEGVIDAKRVVSAAGIREMLSEQSRLPQPRGQIRREDSFGLGWMRGTFRGRGPYYSHGGGYTGAAAYVAFMPREKIGMAVVVNADDAGGVLTNLIGVDVFDKLLGNEPDEKLYKSYLSGAKQFLSQPSRKPIARPLDDAGAKPEAFAGTYHSELHGDLHVTNDSGRLSMQLGDLRAELIHIGSGEFIAWTAPGLTHQIRCDIDAGKPRALVLDNDDTPARRFVRR